MVSYPLAIFAGLQWFEPRTVSLALLAVLALRALQLGHRPPRESLRVLAVPALMVGVVLGGTLVWNDARYLLFVPAGVNAALLLAFGRTLWRGPPLIETFARLQHPDLNAAEVRHCRRFTRIWCGFFLVNTGVCAALALAGDLRLWTLHTGLLSYGIMGLLFSAEFAVRSRRFGRTEGGAFEPVFRLFFPKVRRSG
jgi:uncharacterized membrane protein